MPTISSFSITPEVFTWARETAHLNIEDIPKSYIEQDKLISIEKGEILPTFRETEKLAKYYDRSLGVLLGINIPETDSPQIPIFRRKQELNYGNPLLKLIKNTQYKQEWTRNYLLENGSSELNFIGSVELGNNHVEIANLIKNSMSLSNPINYKHNEREKFLLDLKRDFENNGILVFITGSDLSNKSISLEEAKGFALVDEVAPCIFVNTKNTMNAKIFTMLHELAHLFLNETGISDEVIKFRSECNSREEKIENFCDLIASEILMPKDNFKEVWNKNEKFSIENKIKSASHTFLTSELAVCIKALRLGLMPMNDFLENYSRIRTEIDNFLKNNIKKSSGGNYYYNMKSRNGQYFSELVFYAYKNEDILATEASDLLGVKINNFDKYFNII